ncbi:MAG TPA: DUF2330 domain-containing protein, partial [Polyangiaceae bacterium]|nr:DUF2330 domain-containing protein [Polyangiaceae bacterium]
MFTLPKGKGALCVAALFALIVLVPGRVLACGGFFCSQTAPVNQSAEQIIFSKNADGTVTAVVSIQYQGPSTKFAWVLPIAGKPDVGVSSSLAFQRLLTATTPQYTLTQRVEGTCKPGDTRGVPNTAFAGGTPTSAMADGSGSGHSVNVVAQGSVGPYDYVAISVAQDAGAPAQVALDWLASNNFDVSALGADILNSYLEQGLNLLAFRLNKDSDTGSIRPISVTYPADYPAIPIRPTAVAATPNMGVMVYLVADAQGIPKNYKSLVLNEALINWFSFASTYNQVINRAADEAGGQGFVTEFGGASTAFSDTIWSPNDQISWENFQNGDFSNGQFG